MTIRIFGHTYLEYLNQFDTNIDIDFYVDTYEYHPSPNKKIYIQHEPGNIWNCYYHLRDRSHWYDLIFCYDPSRLYKPNILGLQKPNVFIRSCGHTWIARAFYTSINITKKQFAISNFTGHKSGQIAYHFRHHLYQNQKAFEKFPITFYRSSAHIIIPEIGNNPCIPDMPRSSKYILFENYQYHIIIENSRETNFFSEKLIDCLITKTIPIYYGCDNIGEFFDTTGWIIITDEINFLQDLYNQLHKLNESYYMNHLEIIEKNYQSAIKYCNSETNMLSLLKQHLP
jgi:hypothetical protein